MGPRAGREARVGARPVELPGSVFEQIGQRSMKRLCRQKVGMDPWERPLSPGGA